MLQRYYQDNFSSSYKDHHKCLLLAQNICLSNLAQSQSLASGFKKEVAMLTENRDICATAAVLAVPKFTLREVFGTLSVILNKSASSTIYALKGFPNLAVKELRVGSLEACAVRDMELELAILPKFTHPHILKYHQALRDGETIYIIMNRHQRTVENMLVRHKRTKHPIPEQKILCILEQVASGFAYLHDSNKTDVNGDHLPDIVHRNVKHSNILTDGDERHFVLADFRLYRGGFSDETDGTNYTVYKAPEVLLYNRYSTASDIWSLGVIIYELATLKRLDFLGDKEPKDIFVDGWKPDLSAISNNLIRKILGHLLVLKAEDRISARKLAEILRLYQSEPKPTLPENGCESSGLNGCVGRSTTDTTTSNMPNNWYGTGIPLNLSVISASRQLEAQPSTEQCLNVVSEQPAVQTKPTLGVSVHLVSKNASWAPLMYAAVTGDVETAKQHLSDKYKENGDEDTALVLAARAGHRHIVELLDPTDENGVTALMRAADRGDEKTVRALVPLQRRAQTTGEESTSYWARSGRTALMGAVVHGHMRTAELLVEHEGEMTDKNGRTALLLAADNNRANIVPLLINKEARIRDKQGRTPLMWAAHNGHTECVKLLLEREAGMQDENGWTALMYAAACDHIDSISLLLNAEARMQESGGWTALMIAAQNRYSSSVSLLADKEAGLTNRDGQTALMYAARNGHYKSVSHLTSKEARIQSDNGWTALMLATYHHHINCVLLLAKYENGMKTRLKWQFLSNVFPSGTTALGIAKQRDNRGIVNVLSRYPQE